MDSNMLGNQAVEHLKNAKWPHIRKITLSKVCNNVRQKYFRS